MLKKHLHFGHNRNESDALIERDSSSNGSKQRDYIYATTIERQRQFLASVGCKSISNPKIPVRHVRAADDRSLMSGLTRG